MIKVLKAKAEAEETRAKEKELRPAKRKAGTASMVSNMDQHGPHPQIKVDGQPKIGQNGTKSKTTPTRTHGARVIGKRNPMKEPHGKTKMMAGLPDIQVVMIGLDQELTTSPLPKRA